jgi:hypothetical protein
MKNNIKIMLGALMLVLVIVSLTGVVTASYISTYTDIRATHFTHESLLEVSGYIPATSAYSQSLVAEFVSPAFPPVDLALSTTTIEGDNYAQSTEISSTPTGSEVSITIGNADSVTGNTLFWNCALWGEGTQPLSITYPQELGTGTLTWESVHPAGSVYPAYSTEIHNIYWP